MKGNDKKNLIFKAAVKVIADQGIDFFSINNICKEANISKGGFIYHFPSKEVLLAELNNYILNFSKQLLKEELQNYECFTEAYIMSCLRGFDSNEMKAYVSLPSYYIAVDFNEPWEQFYSYIRSELEQENSEEWVSVILLCTDGIWMKHSKAQYTVAQLERTLKFLLDNIRS